MLRNNTTIEANQNNNGIKVGAGGQLLVTSCDINNCSTGIWLTDDSYCDFASSKVVELWGDDENEIYIYNNKTAIDCDSYFSGTLILDHVSHKNAKINIEDNDWGLEIGSKNCSVIIEHASFYYNIFAITNWGNLVINNIDAGYNSRGILNQYGTTDFYNGKIHSTKNVYKPYGIYNENGTFNIYGGSVANNNVGIWNFSTFNFYNAKVSTNKVGIRNFGNFNMYSGNVTSNSYNGIENNSSDSVVGQLFISGGNITSNTNYDIYHEKSDSKGAGAINGGFTLATNSLVTSKIYLASEDNYIYTSSYYPQITNITVLNPNVERPIIRTDDETQATSMINNINVKNKGDCYYKANATDYSNYIVLWKNFILTTFYKTEDGDLLDTVTQTYEYKENYNTEEKSFENYILLEMPINSEGIVTDNINVTYIYRNDANIAVVEYNDDLSGIVSAKYWYNSETDTFDGDGIDFSNNTIFENYGYYKIEILNGVGLENTITFILDKNSA